MRRAIEQDIVVTRLDIADDSFIFHVQGVSGEYMIEIYEDVTLWPPTCDCQDYYWRGNALCSNISIFAEYVSDTITFESIGYRMAGDNVLYANNSNNVNIIANGSVQGSIIFAQDAENLQINCYGRYYQSHAIPHFVCFVD